MDAYTYGRLLAKHAYDFSGVDEDNPILNRVLGDTLAGARMGSRVGAGLGALGGMGAGAYAAVTHGMNPLLGVPIGFVGGTLLGSGVGGLGGGALGMGVGGLHGGYDAGLVHALKRRENPDFDDNPTMRSALVNMLMSAPTTKFESAMLTAGLGGLASELGKSKGRQVEDPAAALAAMRA